MAYLLLQRGPSCTSGTPGTLYLCDHGTNFPLCVTLEPEKLDNSSGNGIPFGSYNISLTYSPKFNRSLPLLVVAGRSGIRIHAGNTIDDTCGCILVGISFSRFRLFHSKLALQYVINVILDLKIDKIQITC